VGISNVTTLSDESFDNGEIRVKRAIETEFQKRGIQDLVRVTRSVYSDIYGSFYVTVRFPQATLTWPVANPRVAVAAAEGVMQAYLLDYPDGLPALVP